MVGEELGSMARRGAVSARQRAREARARLDEERLEHEKRVDEQVVAYLVSVDEVQAASEALEAAREALQLAQDRRVAALGGVLEIEKDAAVVRSLTGATAAEVSEAKRSLKTNVAAAESASTVTRVASANAPSAEDSTAKVKESAA
ncbi:MAG: hypothetical protein Q4F67_03045 [Propionibacteriaceae bacterium]|nr:hypothetical protein [Propionibacteriaceae bacterium]